MKAMFVLLAAALAACQAAPSGAPGNKPPPLPGAGSSAGSSGGGSATASGAGEKAGQGSWYGMCELNRKILEAPTPQDRQALLEQVMPGMSPEVREQHLQMMRRNCE